MDRSRLGRQGWPGCSPSGPGAGRPSRYGHGESGRSVSGRSPSALALLGHHRAIELARAWGCVRSLTSTVSHRPHPPGARRCDERKAITDGGVGPGVTARGTAGSPTPLRLASPDARQTPRADPVIHDRLAPAIAPPTDAPTRPRAGVRDGPEPTGIHARSPDLRPAARTSSPLTRPAELRAIDPTNRPCLGACCSSPMACRSTARAGAFSPILGVRRLS